MVLFQECIEWAKEERRTFLRQSLESRLIGLYYDTERFSDALQLGSTLLRELKKLDDKNLLVEVRRRLNFELWFMQAIRVQGGCGINDFVCGLWSDN